ncbi:Retrovirus-related Pol polyprotein from transposon RE1 [Bienertia sinuspersici]
MSTSVNPLSTFLDPSQDPTSPYYLHPSDSPGMKLVSDKFSGSNFSDWKRSMMLSLSAKNKLGFIDGSIVKPSVNDPLYKSWSRCNSMLISWFLGVLDTTISRSVLYFNTAKDIWDNLDERFGQSSGTALFSLQQSLHEIKQGEDSVSELYTKLKMLWDELDSLDPLPVCSCSNCSRGVTARLIKSQQDIRLVQFLMKLNENFAVIRSNIFLLTPLPSIAHAYRLLVQDEQHKQISNSNAASEESMAFVAHKRRFNDSQSDKRPPPYSRFSHNSDNRSGKRNTVICDYCKIPGHTASRCYKLNGYPNKVRKGKNVAALSQSHESIESNAESSTPSPAFTPDQYQKLLSLINQSQPNDITSSDKTAFVAGKLCLLSTLNSAWILDSGATDHICHDLSYLFNVSSISSNINTITIPDGSKVVVSLKGSIKLGDKYILSDVLYVPHFQFNLISIPKLCKDLGYETVVSNDHCFIQDPSMRTQLLSLPSSEELNTIDPLPESGSATDQSSIPISEMTLHEYSMKTMTLIETFLKAMARSLNLEENSFFELWGNDEEDMMHARFNFYPRYRSSDQVIGLKPHGDGTVITILLQDKEVEGLQVFKDDRWFRVPIIPQALSFILVI